MGLRSACVVLMAALTIAIVWAVLSRKLGASVGWYDELVSVLLAWVSFIGASLAVLHGAHLGFDNIADALGVRARLGLLVLREGLFFAFFATLGWAGLGVIRMLRGDTLTSLPWIPVSLTQAIIPIACALLIISEFLMLPEKWAAESAPKSAKHEAEEKERLA